MSRRGKSMGWAAFDLKHQPKQGLELEADKEPYPPVSSTVGLLSGPILVNNDLSVRSFSSVLLPSGSVPQFRGNKNNKPLHVGDFSTNQSNGLTDNKHKGYNISQDYDKLKLLHSWADKSLIEDLMAAVHNNFDEASTLLTSMASSSNFEKNKEKAALHLQCSSEDFPIDGNTSKANKRVPLDGTIDFVDLNCDLHRNKQLIDDHASCGEVLPDLVADMGNLRFIPVEPEWEEDDVYLIYRKDALRMMRSASRHSKAANDAYLRGDHLSAWQSSSRAREEWKAAERLNEKAAKDILNIRNCNNDVWKLDLHGLHAAEAVQALQDHLQKIEFQLPSDRSLSPNKIATAAGVVRSSSAETLNCVDVERPDERQRSSRQNPTSLEVITGRGNHSRGQAALPTAIEGFLIENGYHYNEARPGMITVRPKLHRRQ